MNTRRKRLLAQIDRAAEEQATPRPGRPRPLLSIPSTEAQNEFGRVLDLAAGNTDIAITRHNVVRAVLVSVDRYRELTAQDAPSLDALSARFEELYAAMQDRDVRAATARAIDAAPEEMGRAAMVAARRERSHPQGS
ncbi:MAG: type II toxin-antitoxin system prevent-host-death family antitoxin [Gemmatimonadaceae bacterium]